ncbi:MAG: Zinc ABC transporter periplasmic zinc-binding protein [Candidatus Tokpelaia hoelldobleri]|uniref:High-affinity zinc uptake system protein ZnuA n=1 Tax=Candidatus Tokpelaia hoelldobleri TaxID=1902579 RepID=A0A1U9JUL5_9HYPH|nr:MAG: Zinc ABC transporter periplasmic zinc-binding protein [Candidatus Tokpelaia hoelldoblerii]
MKFFPRILQYGILALTLLFLPLQAFAAPVVAVSIKPLHSLAAAVMQGMGEPALIVEGTGSEHGYQLRPKDARLLAGADIVFWAGEEMEGFLVKPLESLAARARQVALSQAPGVQLLDMRADGDFETHTHRETHNHHKDLHFWLDPQNAKAAVAQIAAVLAQADPANAARYSHNARAYNARLDALTADIARELAPVRGRPFIVFHDAYQYFERRFDIMAAGSVTLDPEHGVGAKRLAQVRRKVKTAGPVCVFSEPQFEPRLVMTVIEGTEAQTGVLDPLGADIAAGAGQYPALVRNLAASLKNCLSRE